MSQILAMAEKLQENEQTINDLRTALNHATTLRAAGASQHLRQPESHNSHTDSPRSSVRVDTTTVAPLLSDLSLDENGTVR